MKSLCETNSDLCKANEHMDRKRRRRAQYRARTKPIRDRRRQLALLMAGINRGWLA